MYCHVVVSTLLPSKFSCQTGVKPEMDSQAMADAVEINVAATAARIEYEYIVK